jgi:polar amino acid transport system substrate-binding protein
MNTRSALCATAIALVLVTGCGGSSAAPIPAPSVSSTTAVASVDQLAVARADLAPTGTLRVAIFGPPFVGSKDSTGQVHGVAVALASQLGAKLGTPVVVDVYESPDDAIKAQTTWDVLFIPSNANPGVAAAFAYTAPFLLIPHTFLVSDPAIRTAADLDRPTIRIATESSHAGQVHAQLPAAKVVTLENDQSLAQLKAGSVDAFATGRFALLDALKDLPAGYHVLDGTFFTATLAVGVPKDRSASLAWLGGFIEAERSSGALQKIVDATGKQGLEIPTAAY